MGIIYEGGTCGLAERVVILQGSSFFIPCTVPCGVLLRPTVLCLRLDYVRELITL